MIIDSISKRFSACGARIGALISRNKELIGHALKVCQGRLCSSTLDQLGAAALYDAGPAYFASQKEEYHRRRDTLVKKLERDSRRSLQMSFRCVLPDGKASGGRRRRIPEMVAD